ncbi:MAG: aconitate hydratase [Ketobacteraceae bacterium]|nr:aconitate hydratase [Ketobacteraceae bacterium]
MKSNLTHKLLKSHLVDGDLTPGKLIGLRFDQTLCQDATGTLVMLTLEAMNLDRVKTSVSVQYVDHNLIQEDHKNADDHLFLLSAAQRFGAWYSRPGNGISHPLHMKHFAKPGELLIGSDSHTCATGGLGMFAIGAGGADVAIAMAGKPVYLKMPEVWGIRLTGELPPWVSAKDVILEMLRRHDVNGGVNRVLEYYGPGVETLSAMDRHAIANMGAELGATGSVFPSDDNTRAFMEEAGRGNEWQALAADEGCDYDIHEELNLSELEPLIAKPSSPGNVVPVSEVAGEPIYQSYIGSSANPGFRDFAIAAHMVKGETVPTNLSFDINPSTREILEELSISGHLNSLLMSGARLHQAGCNGCIGMGQAPATDKNSLRTTPRNFPGRSGTREDKVWLCSPETAAASAVTGEITDPREFAKARNLIHPGHLRPEKTINHSKLFVEPIEDNQSVELIKGPNIKSLPDFPELPDSIEVPALLKLGDNISTDEILPAGAEILPYRSNIPQISEYVFDAVSETYVEDAKKLFEKGGHAIVAGSNYGQGSSREHAAIAPGYLGLRMVIAKSFARIHWQNLINAGILPLTFVNESDYDKIPENATLKFSDIRNSLKGSDSITLEVSDLDEPIKVQHGLSGVYRDIILEGGIVNWMQTQ